MKMARMLSDNDNYPTNTQMKVYPSVKYVNNSVVLRAAVIATMLSYLSLKKTGVRGKRVFFTSSLRTVINSTKMIQGLKEDFLRI